MAGSPETVGQPVTEHVLSSRNFSANFPTGLGSTSAASGYAAWRAPPVPDQLAESTGPAAASPVRVDAASAAPSLKARSPRNSPSYEGSRTLAPRVGFEPTTLRLTAGCSAVELPRKRSLESWGGREGQPRRAAQLIRRARRRSRRLRIGVTRGPRPVEPRCEPRPCSRGLGVGHVGGRAR